MSTKSQNCGMKANYILTIKADDRPGLLHLVTGTIEKGLVRIISLNYAPTDIHSIVLITIELTGEEHVLRQLALKLENIVEVSSVELVPYELTLCLRTAYFKVSNNANVLSRYDTTLVKFYPNAVLLAKYGTDEAISKLYNELEGPYLMGFSQTGLITDSKLIGEDESSVISWLAA